MPDAPRQDQTPDAATASAAPDAAPASDPAPFSWRDMARDLLRPRASQLVFAAIVALVAFAVTVQVQTQARDQTYAGLRRADLVALLDDLTAESRRLETEVARLENTRRQLQSGVDSAQVAQQQARARLDALELLGGTVPAQGPGVRITIHDPAKKVTPEILYNAVSELRDAGAEVIELNDSVRLVASSWVAGSADGIVVDGRTLQRPIVIEAIGPAQTLAEATRFRGGLVSSIEGARVGGSVTVVEVDALRVDSVVTPRPTRFARPS